MLTHDSSVIECRSQVSAYWLSMKSSDQAFAFMDKVKRYCGVNDSSFRRGQRWVRRRVLRIGWWMLRQSLPAFGFCRSFSMRLCGCCRWPSLAVLFRCSIDIFVDFFQRNNGNYRCLIHYYTLFSRNAIFVIPTIFL